MNFFKSYLFVAIGLLLGFCAFAQDLDTVSVSDQFTSGARGNESAACGIQYGGACVDGSDAVTITNTGGVTGSISYVNSWAGASTGDPTNGESPVRDVTAAHVHPDRNTSWAAIPANTRPGATSPNNAVLICDDGGHNGLYWGQEDDQNYYVEADVYCAQRTDLTTASYEAVGVCIRAASREGSWVDYTFNMDRSGSYALVYDEITNTIEAVTWARNTTTAAITSRAAESRTIHAAMTPTANGWHTFRVEANGARIVFKVNEGTLADVIDGTYTNGYAGLVLREAGVDSALERPGYFDNMKSGPSSITAVDTWRQY